MPKGCKERKEEKVGWSSGKEQYYRRERRLLRGSCILLVMVCKLRRQNSGNISIK